MRLMVGEVLEVVTRVQKILQHYRGSTMISMLDDIYHCCCIPEELMRDEHGAADVLREDSPAPKKVAGKKPVLDTEADFIELLEKLRREDRNEAEMLLKSYTVKHLVAFADYMSISVKKSGPKDVIVGQICNHYGFRQLNSKMVQRPDMLR